MKTKTQRTQWVPEILYEENSQIPFIEVPEGEEDPTKLFISIMRKTGEVEPGEDGSELPIYDMNLEMFVNIQSLKNKISPQLYDEVRMALGLKPLKEAMVAGMAITEKIRSNVEKNN